LAATPISAASRLASAIAAGEKSSPVATAPSRARISVSRPKLALQMDQPLTSNLAEFAAVDGIQPFLSGQKSLNRVKPRRIAAVDRHPLIPIAAVGGAEFVTVHRPDLIPLNVMHDA
jgi:hypothetical protein